MIMREESTEQLQEISARLFRLIRGIVRDRDLALDLTQDVLVRLLRRPVPADPARFRGYAVKAAYHAALNALRDRKRRERIQERLEAEVEALGLPSQSLRPDETMHLRRRLSEVLAQLSAKQREVVEFRFYGGLTTEETAIAMNISIGAVKVHLYRALGRLSELVTPTKEERRT
jgi:RNA polymerase sigma-70 factor (ECF subfamily)